ncbi:diguanylate cyclase domain-containing protein [Aliarcobacter lanthieri]|uniref:sensor domain-containing diguanylate cyclase n=1 Tax=Aliarcobacter lanthieri TaxID=1355374 RepID=UPI003AFA0F91
MKDLILPIVCSKYNISYIIFDKDLKIVDFAKNMQDFVEIDLKIENNSDIRDFFWEFVGFEDSLDELYLSKKEYLLIPMIFRNNIYYDVNIEICFIKGQKYFIAMYTKQQKNSIEYFQTIQKINETNFKNYIENKTNNKINEKLISFHIDKDGIIKKANSACTCFLGLEENDLIGKHFSLYFFSRNKKIELNNHSNILRAESKDGIEVFFHAESISINNDVSSDKIIVCQDITYLKKIEIELEYAVNHDSLTGLPNRLYLIKKIEENIEKSKNNKLFFALCFIDLNKFKAVNDNYGHHVGDMLLKHVGEVLKHIVREEDTVSRLGGDEFVVLLDSLESIDYLEKTVLRIKEVSKKMPFHYNEDIVIELSFSFGISIYPRDGKDAKILIDSADKEMYLNKIR